MKTTIINNSPYNPILRVIILLSLSIIIWSCSKKATEWKQLFNGNDLNGWDTYIGPRLDSLYNNRDSIPLGLNNDPLSVFSIVQTDGQPAIRISGEQFGGISTVNKFKNYHLQLEFKWGFLKWPPKKKSKRDSGLLYHAVGPHGADGGFWMRSQEFQIQEGDCADYWGVAGGIFDVRAQKQDSALYIYDPTAELLAFSETNEVGRHCVKNPDSEKPTGEWNTIDLYCFGDTAIHIVNGTVNMILYNSRQADNGKETPLTQGKIQLQSEGAEIFYRNIRVQSITEIPTSISQNTN